MKNVKKKIEKKEVKEKKFEKEVKEIKENKKVKVETTLEKEVIVAGDIFETKMLSEVLKRTKTPILEKITTRKTIIEEEVPAATPAKNNDDIKYSRKIDYGTPGEEANKDRRDIRYQTATEYSTGKEERRKDEAFDPTLMNRGDKKANEPPARNFETEYQVKKRKYE